MINPVEFINRLQQLMDYHSLSPSAFADAIGVQRSTLSHVLSGRNNPSLDFVMRILQTYPEVDLYWLLNGKGPFPKTRGVESAANIATGQVQKNVQEIHSEEEKPGIQRIVIFYNDGTFEEFKENKGF